MWVRGCQCTREGEGSEGVAELAALCFQVTLVVWVGVEAEGELLGDFEAVAVEADDLFGVVGEEADLADSEVVEDLGAHAIVAEVGGEAEFFVGFDGVEALLLEFVGVDLGGEADAAAFLAEVEEDAALAGDELHGGVELATAVAAAGAEDIAGEAFGVDADEGGGVGLDFAAGEGEVVGAVGEDAVEVAVEIAEVGGHFDGGFLFDEFLLAAAVLDDLGDGAGLEAVFALVVAEVADAGHGAVLVHDFAEDAGGGEIGHAGQVDGGLGVAGAAEDATLHGLEGEDVAGLDEGVGTGFGVGEELDGEGAVGGGNAGGDASGGIDGNGEGGAVALAVAAGHGGEVEGFDALGGDGGADEAAALGGHEGDHLGGDEGGGADEVSFVLAAGVVGDDHQTPGGDIGDDFLNWAEIQCNHGVSVFLTPIPTK